MAPRLVVAVGVGVLALLPAAARGLPPPSKPFDEAVVESWELRGNADPCAAMAKKAGVFGAAIIRFHASAETLKQWQEVVVSRGVPNKVKKCLARAAAAAADAARFDTVDFPEDTAAVEVALGEPPADGIADPAVVLPLWTAFIDATTAKARKAARRKLDKVLPPFAELTDAGCIRVGLYTATEDAARAWRRKIGRGVAQLWLYAKDAYRMFELVPSGVGAIREVRWVGEHRLLFADMHAEGTEQCLVRVDDDWEEAALAETETVAACLPKDLEERLVAPRLEFPADLQFTKVSTSSFGTCALTAAGTLVCCGAGTVAQPPTGRFTDVSVGRRHACAISDGKLRCWGDDTHGQGKLPEGSFRRVYAYGDSTCAIDTSSGVHCWGQGGVPDPGNRKLESLALLAGISCGLTATGKVSCWGDNATTTDETYLSLAGLPSGKPCGLRFDRSADCGDQPTTERLTDLAMTAQSVCGITIDGTLRCWHAHCAATNGTCLPVAPPTGTFTSLSASSSSMCGITASGGVTCWGNTWPGALLRKAPYE